MAKSGLRIGVQMDLQHDHGIRALLGLGRYAASRGWSLVLEQVAGGPVPDWANADVSGLIVQAIADRDAGLADLPFPVVSTTALHANVLTSVYSDADAVGRLAAEYLLSLPLTHFAFLGQSGHNFSHRRQAGYEAVLHAAGYESHTLVTASGTESLQWLKSVPKPVGLMVANDLQAGQLLRVCAFEGYDIRERVAVVGVDNEARICEFSHPTLTSVEQQIETVGYLAAVTLDAMRRGKHVAQSRLVPPRAVVARESTRLQMIDPQVTHALSLIRQHAHEYAGIDDLLAHVPLSRRTLERRFRATLGRSPLEEIQRVRLAEAKRLLSTTDLSVELIARQVGCGSATWLGKLMRAENGRSPSDYRRRARAAQADNAEPHAQ